MNSAQSVQRAPAASRGGEASEPSRAAPAPRGAWLDRYRQPVATLIVGLVVTGALAVVSHSQYASNETRLLKLRVRDASTLVSGALLSVQTPLASAAELADATGGNVAKFKVLAAPSVGPVGSGHQYISMSLWRLGSLAAGPIAVEGQAPVLAASPGTASSFLATAARSSRLSVVGLLRGPTPRLGYAIAGPRARGGYVVYAESPLPANRRSQLQSTSAFAGLDYALYLGSRPRLADLLVTNVNHFPMASPSAAAAVPFGNNALTLVMSSRSSLAGALPRDLPWVIAALGAVLAVAAAAMTLRLTQRRRRAEELAGRLEVAATENERLYAEQRGIAQTLQHALLPDRLPQIPGMQTSARYEAGEQGVDVGGDWYDVIRLDDRRLMIVVGDVSGRGLPAATTMAALRYAIRAYAAQDDGPSEILTKIGRLVDVTKTGQLATVLCATVDIETRELSVSSAGHLPLLVLSDGDGCYVEAEAGVPIGVQPGAAYRPTTMTVPAAATVVAFTDGLVERRGESIDDGLDRLRAAGTGDDVALPELLGRLVSTTANGRSQDDIAIVGVRWTS